MDFGGFEIWSREFTSVNLYKNKNKKLSFDTGELYYELRSLRGVSHK